MIQGGEQMIDRRMGRSRALPTAPRTRNGQRPRSGRFSWGMAAIGCFLALGGLHDTTVSGNTLALVISLLAGMVVGRF